MPHDDHSGIAKQYNSVEQIFYLRNFNTKWDHNKVTVSHEFKILYVILKSFIEFVIVHWMVVASRSTYGTSGSKPIAEMTSLPRPRPSPSGY